MRIGFIKKCYNMGISPIKRKDTFSQENRGRREVLAYHKQIGTVKGFKYKMNLPIRGQRNKTNGRTAAKLSKK